jgi:hypothetical protein
MLSRLAFSSLVVVGFLGACSSSVHETAGQTSSGTAGGPGAGGQAASSSASATGGMASSTAGTGGAGSDDGGVEAGVPDGTPTRATCTSQFGTALTSTHGRMDGLLVSIVPPGSMQQCNDDTGHVHLQVQIAGAVYDVAVNTDVLYAELDVALPGGPWAEGWHQGESLDYPTTFGLHTAAFTTSDPASIATKIETELAAVNHISIFATGYGPDGAHDVHRQGKNEDGAIAINPLSPKAHVLTFCFSTDSF